MLDWEQPGVVACSTDVLLLSSRSKQSLPSQCTAGLVNAHGTPGVESLELSAVLTPLVFVEARGLQCFGATCQILSRHKFWYL